MRFKLNGVALAAAVLSAWLVALPAQADNYQVRDGLGVPQTFCSRTVGVLQFPCHLMFGMFGNNPTPVAVDADGNFKVSIQNAPLPSGASTLAAQTAGNAALTAIDGKLADQATAALQTAGNASLTAIAGSTGSTLSQVTSASLALGGQADATWTGTGSGSLVAINKYIGGRIEAARALQATGNANLASIDADLGGASDAPCATDGGSCSITALLKRGNERLTTLLGAPLTVNCVSGCGGAGGGGASGPAEGFVVIPASGAAALAEATRGVLITAPGNLGLELADGSNNDAALLPVVAGQVFPFRAIRRTASNTAGILGLK